MTPSATPGEPADTADDGRLTDEAYWDEYWAGKTLPLEMRKSPRSLYLNEILAVFDRCLPRDPRLSIAEIGGSPGQYLAYMHRTFGYTVSCIDYSRVGCRKTEENFRLLGIPGSVVQLDVLAGTGDLPHFDIVYSLGFIEHFADLDAIIGRHLALLKPGGILVIGAPNFLGVAHWFLRRLAPRLLAGHNLRTMDIDSWTSFEQRYHLRPLFKGYVGGFEPSTFNRCEQRTLRTRLLKLVPKTLHGLVGHHLQLLRRFNSKYTSGYVMGVYRAPNGV